MKVLVAISLALLLMTEGNLQADPNPISESADSLMKGHWELGNLIEWELVRLESLGSETLLEFPKDSKLAEKIFATGTIKLKNLNEFLKNKPSLSDSEKQELLGVLRLANTKNRVELEDNETVYRTLITEELKKMDPLKELKIQVPQEIMESLGLTEEKKITPQTLSRAFESAKGKKTVIPEKILAPLLGNIRQESAKDRGVEFISDQIEDLALDKLFTEVGQTNRSNKLSKEIFNMPIESGGIRPFVPSLVGQEPELPNIRINPPAELNPGTPGFDAPSHQFAFSNRGALESNFIPFPRRDSSASPSILFNDFGLGDGLILDRERLGEGVGEVAPELSKLKEQGKFSLLMRMSFQSGTDARCQITIVKKEEVGDKCSYKAATARHCVINEENRGDKLQSIGVQGLGRIFNPTFEVDPFGNDFAILSLSAACADVPVVPLRKDLVRDQEQILVETVPGGTMEGRAIDAVSGNSLMALDVRSSNNKPFGINPGDSGGGVAALGADGKLELVGVISSKPIDPELAGIGFFAAKSSMTWAYNFVNASGIARQPVTDQFAH